MHTCCETAFPRLGRSPSCWNWIVMENDWALFAHVMMSEGRYLSHHLKVKTAHPYVMPVMLYRELAFSCEALLQMVCHAQGSRLDIVYARLNMSLM